MFQYFGENKSIVSPVNLTRVKKRLIHCKQSPYPAAKEKSAERKISLSALLIPVLLELLFFGSFFLFTEEKKEQFYAFFALGSRYSMPSSKRTEAGGSSSSSGWSRYRRMSAKNRA